MSQQVDQGAEPHPDTKLMASLRDELNESFEQLFVKYQKLARTYAIREVRDPGLADDIVNEAFTKILSAIRRGRGPTHNFVLYLRATVQHEAWRVKQQTERMLYVDDLEPYVMGNQREIANQAELGETLHEAMQILPPRWRHVIELRVVYGYSNLESAEQLSLTAQGEAQLYRRARKGLTQAIAQLERDR